MSFYNIRNSKYLLENFELTMALKAAPIPAPTGINPEKIPFAVLVEILI
jgi:hypothetical protein